MSRFYLFILLLLLGFPGLSYCQSPSARIVKMSAYDHGAVGTQDVGIDVKQGTCGRVDQNGDGDTEDPEDVEVEPLSDTLLGVSIANSSDRTVFIQSMSYQVSDRGDGTPLRTRRLAPSSTAEIASGDTPLEVTFLFIRATEQGDKVFTGSSTAIPEDFGFRNVTITIHGRDSEGRRFRVSRRTALSFANFDRCE